MREQLPSQDADEDGSEFLLLPSRSQSKPIPRPDIYLHPSTWSAFEVFCACRTQWRLLAGFSGVVRQGLDYNAARAVMQMMGIKKQSQAFRYLQYLEIGAIGEFNEQQNLSNNAADSR